MKCLIFMILLLIVAGCAERKNSTVDFKVSSSMMLSNGVFGGGLYIQGKGPNGINFSKFIPYSPASADATLSIDLLKGSWTFETVAWQGSGKFNGVISCDSLATTISGDAQSINLTPYQSKCTADKYGSSGFATAVGAYKNLSLVTCGQFYDSTGNEPSSFTPGYCNSGIYSGSQKWAGAARFSILVKDLVQEKLVPDLNNSICFVGGNGQLSPAVVVTPPVMGVPFQVDLLESDACNSDAKIISSYVMPKGIQYNYMQETDDAAKLDKRLYGLGTNYLVLTTTPIHRGTSPANLRALKPNISCSSGSCAPTATANVDFVGKSGDTIQISKYKSDVLNCSNFSWTSTTNLITSANTTRCIDDGSLPGAENGGIYLQIFFNEANCTSTCSWTYTLNGMNKSITAKGQTNSLKIMMDTIYQSIGHWRQGSGDPKLSMVSSYVEDDKDFGRLSMVNENFSPDGPAGLFDTINCASNAALTEKQTTFWDKDQFKTYRVQFVGAGTSHAIPKYICETANFKPSACSVYPYYDMIMSVQRLVGSVYVNESIMKFNCASKIGQLERHNIDSSRNEKELLFWNTDNEAYARYEYYNYEVRSTSNHIDTIYTNYERAEKFSSSAVRIDSCNFSSEFKADLNAYKQYASSRNVIIDKGAAPPKILYIDRNLSNVSTTNLHPEYDLFTDHILTKELTDISYLPTSAIVYSPDRTKALRASTISSAFMQADFLMGAGTSDNSLATTYNVVKVKADISNSGYAVYCWTDVNGGSHARIFNGSTWVWPGSSNTNINLAAGATSTYIDCKIQENGNAWIAVAGAYSTSTGLNMSYVPLGSSAYSSVISVPAGYTYRDFVLRSRPDGTMKSFAGITLNTNIQNLSLNTWTFTGSNLTHNTTTYINLFGGDTSATILGVGLSDTAGTILPYVRANLTSGPAIDWLYYSEANDTVTASSSQNSATGPLPQFQIGNLTCAAVSTTLYIDPATSTSLVTDCPTSGGSFAPTVKGFGMNLQVLNPVDFVNFFTTDANFN